MIMRQTRMLYLMSGVFAIDNRGRGTYLFLAGLEKIGRKAKEL